MTNASTDGHLRRYGQQCFLCLRPFDDDQVEETAEDVFPKWLVRYAGLTESVSTLPNGQKFRYPQRVVPCCYDCNQFMSATLEAPISAAFKAGFDAVAALPEETTTLWLAKLFYGTRWRELALRINVADQNSPTLNTPEVLTGNTEYLRQLLLSGPGKVKFATPPGSVFLYRAGIPTNPDHQFDFMVASEANVIALRAGDVFAVAVFGDNGYWQSQFAGSAADSFARSTTLHPAQCIEIMTFMATRAARLDWSGCWDFITVGIGDPALPGGVTRIFHSSFIADDANADTELLNQKLVATFLGRAFGMRAPDELLAQAAATGSYPTCLRDIATDSWIVATCHELACPALRLAAGWELDPGESACPACGAGPSRAR